jgi:hypothetical protein
MPYSMHHADLSVWNISKLLSRIERNIRRQRNKKDFSEPERRIQRSGNIPGMMFLGFVPIMKKEIASKKEETGCASNEERLE